MSPDEQVRLESLRKLNIVDTPLEERFERITRLTKRLLCVKIAAISLVESDRQWFKSIQGCSTTETSRDISFCGHAILTDEIFVVEDADNDERFKNNPLVLGEPFVKFYAGCPVKTDNGSRVGMLCVNDDKPRQLDLDDAQTLRDLAGLVETELRSASASAVQASLIAEVSSQRRRGLTDELTRLWNRAGVLEIARLAHQEAATGKCAYAIAMIDLDGFKPINDTMGHAAGDEVLRVAAGRMLGTIRDTDVVGRLGGDEFLLVLSPCKNQNEAILIAERVRVRLCADSIRTGSGLAMVKASVGVILVEPGTTATLAEVINEADSAMYESKDGGRNRVTGAPPQRNAA
jgi:diguanylate cyclase (GGDEF)-like protein